MYPGGRFITNASLNQLTNTTVIQMQYQNLKNHIRAHIGPNKKYDAIPLEKQPQKKNTFSTAAGLLRTIKKGSGVYRKIIDRDKLTTNLHNPSKWKRKLDDQYVTSEQVRKAMIHLHSPYLDSTSADYLTRLKLGKTLFRNQLFAIGLTDENNCMTCHREFDQNTTEDYKHALFQCPAVQLIIEHIKRTFFPNLTHSFSITDILVSTNSDKHKLYKGPVGQQLVSLIWDYFQVYVLQCRIAHKTPVPTAAISEIRSQINRILKLLPKSKIAFFITSSPELQILFSEITGHRH